MYVISNSSNRHTDVRGERVVSISEGKRMRSAHDQPENDTRDVVSQHGALSSSLHPNGFVRFLSCFGLFRERNLPNKNFVAVKSSGTPVTAEDCSSDSGREFDYAATKLLRESLSRRQESPCPENEYTAIKHIRQLETWDCGIACIQMALRWLRSLHTETDSGLTPLELMERKLLLESAGTTSIWTVDLVMLLEQLLNEPNDNKQQPNHDNTTYLFTSSVKGVNASHSTTGYYAKAFDRDSARVSKIFEDLHNQQLPTLCPYHLEFSQMLDMVSFENCIAIVLVDNSVLMEAIKCISDEAKKKEDTYAGHYVILCGKSYDPIHIQKALAWETTFSGDQSVPYCLVLANPGIPDQVMYVIPERLEQAWRSEGTDCDVIFIAKHNKY